MTTKTTPAPIQFQDMVVNLVVAVLLEVGVAAIRQAHRLILVEIRQAVILATLAVVEIERSNV